LQAGIKGDYLQIALDSNAASLYLKYLPVEKLYGGDKGFDCFKPNSKYLLLDCGGL